MKEISRQSLIRIHDLIYGQNYVNIKARLDQHLPEEYAKALAYGMAKKELTISLFRLLQPMKRMK